MLSSFEVNLTLIDNVYVLLTVFTHQSIVVTKYTVALEATHCVFTCPSIGTSDISTQLNVCNTLHISHMRITGLIYIYANSFLCDTNYNIYTSAMRVGWLDL